MTEREVRWTRPWCTLFTVEADLVAIGGQVGQWIPWIVPTPSLARAVCMQQAVEYERGFPCRVRKLPATVDEIAAEQKKVFAKFKIPTPEEIDAMSIFPPLSKEIHRELVLRMASAFATGCEFVTLTCGGQEVGRIYADGRRWKQPP